MQINLNPPVYLTLIVVFRIATMAHTYTVLCHRRNPSKTDDFPQPLGPTKTTSFADSGISAILRSVNLLKFCIWADAILIVTVPFHYFSDQLGHLLTPASATAHPAERRARRILTFGRASLPVRLNHILEWDSLFIGCSQSLIIGKFDKFPQRLHLPPLRHLPKFQLYQSVEEEVVVFNVLTPNKRIGSVFQIGYFAAARSDAIANLRTYVARR